MKKRIALSAVAALAGGLLVAAPASAANTLDSMTVTSEFLTGISAGGYTADAEATFLVDSTATVPAAKLTLTFPTTAALTADNVDEVFILDATTGGDANLIATAEALGDSTRDTATSATADMTTAGKAVFSIAAGKLVDGTYQVNLNTNSTLLTSGTYSITLGTDTVNATWSWKVVDAASGLGSGDHFLAVVNPGAGEIIAGANNFAVIKGALPKTPASSTTIAKLSGAAFSASAVAAAPAIYPTTTSYDAGATGADTALTAGINAYVPADGTVTFAAFNGVGGQFSDLAWMTLSFTVTAADDNVYAAARVTGGDEADATQEIASKASATAVDTLTVKQYNAAGEPIGNGYAKAVSVVLTGDAGSLADGTATTRTTSAAYAAGTSAAREVQVYANGTAGTSKVAISVNGVLVHTETYVFTGDVATVTATQSQSIVGVGDTLGVITTEAAALLNHAVALAVKDAAGNDLKGATVLATSSNPLVMTETVDKIWLADQKVFAIAATAAGTAKIGETATLTYYVKKADGTKVSAAAVTFTIAGDAKTVTMALDKATYAPGEKATLTITAKDAAGNAAAPTTVSTFAANLATQGLPTEVQAVRNGVKTITLYAPVTAGTWNLSAYDSKLNAITASAAVAVPADANITAINAKVVSTEATVAALQVTVASIIKSLKVQWWLLKKIAVKVGIKLG